MLILGIKYLRDNFTLFFYGFWLLPSSVATIFRISALEFVYYLVLWRSRARLAVALMSCARSHPGEFVGSKRAALRACPWASKNLPKSKLYSANAKDDTPS